MNLLCLDVSSDGISAAVFDSNLAARRFAGATWNPQASALGVATLAVPQLADCFKRTIRDLDLSTAGPVDAICIGAFLHTFVLLDDADQPLTSVFTGLDRRGGAGVEFVRDQLRDRFQELTGCRYHAMFPVFKLAMLRMSDPQLFARAKRAISIKGLLLNWLTGLWVEDHGMASASGLANVNSGDWEPEILKLVGLERSHFPSIVSPTQVVGDVTLTAAGQFGLAAGTHVVAGAGIDFVTNLGSDCETASKIAVTLGASAVARQTLKQRVNDDSVGTFCHKADKNMFILALSSNNGGSVLDWGRQFLGAGNQADSSENPPIFIPLLHGERSPNSDPHLTGTWHGLKASHTPADLSRSILEGVIFNLADLVETVQKTSGETATDLVLSGKGFLTPMAASILASVTGRATWILKEPAIASLRGAGVCALRALGEPSPALDIEQVTPLTDLRVSQRYTEYRRLRAAGPA